MENNYYVYIYLDPRKPGQYSYPESNLSFLFEPIYIGKGKGSRFKVHLTRCENITLKHKINNIHQLNLSPFIIFSNTDISEIDALYAETVFIKSIGKILDDTGTLCNIADGGTGTSGCFFGQSNPCSKTNMSLEKRKAKGQKGYQTRLENGQVRTGTKHNFSSAFLSEEQLLSKTEKSMHTRRETGILKAGVQKMQETKKENTLKYLLISPEKIEHIIHFNLSPFCKEHNLSYPILWRRINEQKFGIIKATKQHTTATQLNTIGWEIKLTSFS